MRGFLFGPRQIETSPTAVAATGAGGSWGEDPVDGDRGFARLGGVGAREQPAWITEKARAYSVAAYRSNPMARAIIDTYVSFAVGDSGVSIQCDDPEVRAVVDAWWTDPKNRVGDLQGLFCRSWMLMGERLHEQLVGERTGVVRFSPIDVSRIESIELDRGNPLWPKWVRVRGHDVPLEVVTVDDTTGLRTGRVSFTASWRALDTDVRGTPFLSPVLDDLAAYEQVLSNLVDRTALARYLVWDVTLKGNQADPDGWIKARGGNHAPNSGTVEVHNESVEWKPHTVSSGSFEDTNTTGALLTNVAGGAGLAKTWLAEPDGANRATSISMAEPVRRRVGAVQAEWLAIQAEDARFVVDQAVAAGRLPRLVDTVDAAGNRVQLPPSQLVHIVGPEIAAADAQVTATMLVNLSTALDGMVSGGLLSADAARVAAEKAWEQFVGAPWRAELAVKDLAAAGAVDDLATEAEAAAVASLAARRKRA